MSALKGFAFYAFLLISLTLPAGVFAQFNVNDLADLVGDTGLSNQGIPSFGEISPGVDALFVTLSLISRPSYPGPYEDFEVELTAPDSKYSGAIIKWYVNGEEELAARNTRKHSFTTGAIAELMRIEVELNLRNGTTEKTELLINPVQVDIILEGLTTVPYFYKGRPAPSRQTPARAVAVINNGEVLNRESLNYEWRLNHEPMAGGSIRGLMGINFDMTLDRNIDLSVTISDQNTVLGNKTISFPVAEPEIIFYEENPLRGISEKAFSSQHQVAGNQVIVRAEPYHLSPFLNNDDFLITWKLDGREINNTGSEEPNVIVMRSTGGSNAKVTFQIINTEVLGQMMLGSFNLRLGNI